MITTETSITELEKSKLVYYAGLERHPLYDVYKEHLKREKEKEKQEAILKDKIVLQKKYPKYKIITNDNMRKFCEKHNLVYKGNISQYERDIPIEALKEIAEINLKKQYGSKDEILYISAPENHFQNKIEDDEDPLVYFFPKSYSNFAVIIAYWNTDDDLSCL